MVCFAEDDLFSNRATVAIRNDRSGEARGWNDCLRALCASATLCINSQIRLAERGRDASGAWCKEFGWTADSASPLWPQLVRCFSWDARGASLVIETGKLESLELAGDIPCYRHPCEKKIPVTALIGHAGFDSRRRPITAIVSRHRCNKTCCYSWGCNNH